MVSSILCPVDFSEHSARALRHAYTLAALTGARVTVLNVIEPLLDAAARAAGRPDDLLHQTQEEMQALLARACPPARSAPAPAVAIAVGNPADTITRHAAECAADLIAIGTVGAGFVRRLFLGSTTERVLRSSSVPVLVVPPGADRTRSVDGLAVWDVTRILVPVTPSFVRSAHVTTAVQWARGLKTPLILLHVLPLPPAIERWRAEIAAGRASRREQADRTLREAGQALLTGVSFEIEIREGRPFEQIPSAAAERNCGLIVVSVGISHRPGVTAIRVVSQSEVPVLVVPNRG
jgi:nucleotide-binding universal stress UspA family protein